MSSVEIPTTPAVAPTPTPTPPATTTTSTIRRKPKITYQSPSAYYNPPSLRIESSAQAFLRSVAEKVGSTSSSPPDPNPNPVKVKTKRKAKKVKDGGVEKKPIAVNRLRYSMGPPLPLYHPLGRLALSLPELDPASLGLPPLPVDDGRRSSARTRRPAAKLREADEEAQSTPAAPATPSIEVKEKPSPKKKGGARPGAGMKRKRKDADEDATYPAKKTRNPRGGASTLARVTTSEAPSPPEAVTPATPESVVEAPEEKKPERRSTRSRATLLRRDSSGSEATATSVSASVVAGKAKSVDVVGSKTPPIEGGKLENGVAKSDAKGQGIAA